ncbi:hypothetical protein FB451DRAFT_1227161 [Mycena latifolia]|nr:hypothetical protein FB451DRAFT_1227161 [Mycena latifolia]
MPEKPKHQALSQSLADAEDLCKFCATTPGMNTFQPIAASAVEVCTAAALVKAHKADKLAAYVVDRTGLLVTSMINIPLSPEILQSLERFELELDEIRRHIEQMPVQSGKKAKRFSGYRLKRETDRLKSELENQLCAALAISNPSSPSASRSDCVLELVSLSTRAVGAICDAPVLNFLKPVVGIAALICDTAKCVKSNHDAAAELVKHASLVTKCIVDRASAMDPASAAGNEDALETLKLTLEDIQAYLTFLAKPRRRLAPWVFANEEKDRFVQLNAALDKALAMFAATEILNTAEDVRSNMGQIGVLVSTMRRMNCEVNRTLTIIHADLHKLSEAPRSFEEQPGPGSAQAQYNITPLPFWLFAQLITHPFFF